MRIDILTLFPELFEPFLTLGMVAQARSVGRLEVACTDLRAFTEDRHQSVDDRPYGGGPGMVIKPEPVVRAVELLLGAGGGSGPGGHRAEETQLVAFCPRGERLRQRDLEELAEVPRLVLFCGRYEGFDERIVESFPWRRLSVGDFVLSGGELAAMIVVEGVARLLPGVLGNADSARRDSFGEWSGRDGNDHPHYTRPPEYRGRAVPEVLLSGNHGEIESWRRERARRPESDRRRGARSPRSDRDPS